MVEMLNIPIARMKISRNVTYKLKLNGGDIKAVQEDSGHAQVSMVMDVYILDDDRKNHWRRAVEIATLAIQKCQKDQTPFFLFLLQDAKDRGDEVVFKRLMQSAHRRRAVNSGEVDAKFS